MNLLSCTSSSFLAALQGRQSIGITTDGNWYKKGFIAKIVTLFRTLFFGYDEALENAKNLITSVHSAEIISLGKYNGLKRRSDWDPQHLKNVVQAVKATLHDGVEKEEIQIKDLCAKRNALQARLTSREPQPPIVDLNKAIFNSEYWVYRSAAANLDRVYLQNLYLGLDQREIEKTEAPQKDCEWLTEQLKEWQDHQFPPVQYVGGTNSDEISNKIRYSCHYTEFIELLRNNRALLEIFFDAVFKRMPDSSTSAIDLFLQAMKIQEQLYATDLDKRLHEIHNKGLQFGQIESSGNSTPIKEVKLLIDGEYQSIADEKASVRIAPGVNKSVAEVYAEFKALIARFITIEYLQDKGVSAFDGRLLDFNFDKKEWWKDLPVIKRMTRKEIEETYHVDTNGDYAPQFVCASRLTPDLNAYGNHSWLEISIPLDDGTFNVVGYSKFSDWFPVTTAETLYHVFHTHLGYVTFLESNTFEICRDRLSVPLPPLTKEQFETEMDYLKTQFLRSRNKELIFQVSGDNCASEVMKLIRHVYPGLDIEPFKTAMLEMVLPSTFMPLLRARALFPNDASWDEFRKFFGWICGALSTYPRSDGKGGVVYESLANNEYYKKGIAQLPAKLWLEKEKIAKRIKEYIPKQVG